MNEKEEGAFLTINEAAAQLNLPQHILRYWETRFKQLRPLTRNGNRRYYRPADVALLHQINGWLNREGYTIKGVQQLLARQFTGDGTVGGENMLTELVRIRDALAMVLAS